MPDIFELTVQFRLIERALLAIVFVGTALFLIFSYRKDTSTKEIYAELSGSKIALPLTKPFVAALLLLGYIFVSLSHPISVKKTMDSESIVFFEPRGISQTFGTIAQRELHAGRIDEKQVRYMQSMLRLSIQIQKLHNSGKSSEVNKILENKSLTLSEIKSNMDAMEN